MKPVDQDKFGVPEGNCFSACVASILRLPLARVMTFCDKENWFAVFTTWLRNLGYFPMYVKYEDDLPPAGFYILSGRSPRGDFLHSVVARGREVVHDPHPSRAGLLSREDCIVIAPLDAGRFDRRRADRIYIFDADSTLRRCTVKGQFCPNKSDEWEPIAWAKTTLALIDWSRNDFAIVSNQGGVGHGHLTMRAARSMLVDLALVMTGIYPSHDAIRICPHPTNEGCECRKPSPWMLLDVLDTLGHHKVNAIYVGDMDTDKLAAENAGIPFVWAWDFCGRSHAEWKAHVDG